MERMWFSVGDSPERFEFMTPFEKKHEWTAEEAAERYHDHHDGWEDKWPLVITIYETVDGPALARYRVGVEAEPHFFAEEIEAS